jgi:hypothetical protein
VGLGAGRPAPAAAAAARRLDKTMVKRLIVLEVTVTLIIITSSNQTEQDVCFDKRKNCSASNDSEKMSEDGGSMVEKWIANIFPSASDITAGIIHRNSLCPTDENTNRTIDFPVILISNPSQSDRANSAMFFLESCGFSDIRFVHPFTNAYDIDLQELFAKGAIDREGLNQLQWSAKNNWPLSLSVILNHMAAIRLGLETGSPIFGVFEDDLMLGTDDETARTRLLDAILELPRDADVLYLEFCQETCTRLSFPPAPRRTYTRSTQHTHPDPPRPAHLVRAHRPFCCAALLFTAAGARRALAHMVPAFDGIDYMYAALVADRRLAAYLLAPPVFFQDGYWASTVRPGGPGFIPGSRAWPGRTHRPYGQLCRELASDPAMRLTVVQALPPPPTPAAAGSDADVGGGRAAPGGELVFSDGLAEYDWSALGGGGNSDESPAPLELVYLTRPAAAAAAAADPDGDCEHGGHGGEYMAVMARRPAARAADPVRLSPPAGTCCARGAARCVVNVSLVACRPRPPAGPEPAASPAEAAGAGGLAGCAVRASMRVHVRPHMLLPAAAGGAGGRLDDRLRPVECGG